ncbi:molybdopterin-dependent oxidoreductase [Aquipuribacter sp. MA13-6]|uniref:molybdopterin-dependent oxidoreductase n=1 Tax=unclassified Aquipuribacter TaxID=2635084 RepID=UPI003EED9301
MTTTSHTASRGALAGVVSAALLLGTASALSAVVGRGSEPFLAVGDTVVRLSPPVLTSFAIETFGSYDKLVLFVGIGVVLAVVAAVSGVLATRRLAVGVAAPVLLVLAAAAAVLASPGSSVVDLLPLLVGTVVGAVVFVRLVGLSGTRSPGATEDRASEQGDGVAPAARPRPAASRRLFLGLVGAGAAASAGLVAVGRVVGGTLRDATASRDGLALPAASNTLPDAPTGAQLVDGAPFRTPNADFYRVDTALTVPQVPAEDWVVRVHGLVERPLELDWAALTTRFEVVDREITLVCVSNPVGGDLAGNAVWRGIRLADVLAEAGVDPRADMLLSTSVDGWTASTPLAALLDTDDPLLAFAMNGEPLPFEHGFPVRMVVPGLYGYVSATKWVVDLEVTTFTEDEAYWTPRGYAAEAPVKVASRIELPASFEQLATGPVVVAGTAWHPGVGIDVVEVQVDDGDWQPAELGEVPGPTTWRQWRYEWAAEPGQHTLRVRATDADGEVQTDERAEIAPDGSSGWHSVVVTVT